MELRATGTGGCEAGRLRRSEKRAGCAGRGAARAFFPLLICSAAVLSGGSAFALPPQEKRPADAPGEGAGEAAAGETAPPEAVADPMQPLLPMVGEWQGEGWIRMGPGEPVRFDSYERVESRLGGEALVIEGTHRAKGTDRLVHNAVALLSHDAPAGLYRFRTHVHGRGPGDFEGRVEDGAFVWGGAMGPGQMRYTIRIDGDRWHEVGEFSPDGEAWRPFFEMNLERVGGG
jgi:hypothetical protein